MFELQFCSSLVFKFNCNNYCGTNMWLVLVSSWL